MEKFAFNTRILLTACLIGMMSHQANSQAALIAMIFGDKVASENFNLSMEIGPVFPMINNIPNSDGSKVGLNFGIAGNFKLSENWFLSPNAYFLARRNAQLTSLNPLSNDPDITSEFAGVEALVQLNYIDVPVFIHYQTSNKKYRLGVAPQISFLKGAEAIFSSSQGDFTEEVSSMVNATDFGMIYNITYVLGKAHKGRGIFVNLRYYHGFNDTFNDSFIAGNNRSNFFSIHFSLPFLTDELAAKNINEGK